MHKGLGRKRSIFRALRLARRLLGTLCRAATWYQRRPTAGGSVAGASLSHSDLASQRRLAHGPRVRRSVSMSKGFMKAGHLPTLFAAFLYFDLRDRKSTRL